MQLSLISDVGSDATLTKSSGDTQVCSLSISSFLLCAIYILFYSMCVVLLVLLRLHTLSFVVLSESYLIPCFQCYIYSLLKATVYQTAFNVKASLAIQ